MDVPNNIPPPSFSRVTEMDLSPCWGYPLPNGYNTDMTAFTFTDTSLDTSSTFVPCYSDEFGLGQLNDMLEQSFFDIFGV